MINTKNFSNIRLVALLSILALHTTLSNVETKNVLNGILQNSNAPYFQLLMHALYVNLFKGGTILFFIISGFLFEMQVAKFKDFTLFVKKKAKSLLLPYFLLFIIPTMIIIGLVEPNFGSEEKLSLYIFLERLLLSLFFSSYWFVPALFVTLIINFFIDTKYLVKSLVVFGLIWLVFYINLYMKFTVTAHTVWFVAFFVIFTLGRLMCVHNNRLSEVNIFGNVYKMLLLLFTCYVISNLESMIILVQGQNTDYVNTLRIGNIAYSLLLFFILNNVFNNIRFVLPFEISFYFIYLTHPFVLKMTHFAIGENIIFEYPSEIFYNIVHVLVVLMSCIIIQQVFFKIKINSNYISDYVFKKK